VPCGSTRDATPTGLVVLLPSGERNYHSMNLQALNNPYVSGGTIHVGMGTGRGEIARNRESPDSQIGKAGMPLPSITCKSMPRTSYTPRRMSKRRRRWWRPAARASLSQLRICSTWRVRSCWRSASAAARSDSGAYAVGPRCGFSDNRKSTKRVRIAGWRRPRWCRRE
jgi:hypothetical protein